MNRIVKPATIAVLTLALAVVGLPVHSAGVVESIGTPCCRSVI